MTLVSAPAGFGKTTCVSEWVNHLALPVAWLSLEPADDDPGRFFAYLVAALHQVDDRLGRTLGEVLRSGQLPPGEAISATLANDILEWQHPFLLVLDDFHVVQERCILQVLESLMVNLFQTRVPQPMHLVLVTREDPALPLARLRADNQLTEVRAENLRFADHEADRFLKEVMGLTLSQADVAALEGRTEGWVVGLQLAALALQAPAPADPSHFIASLSGSHRFILSYLTEQVLSRQPEELQQFLLHTSILGRLNGELCDAVTGRTDSQLVLERLFNANLFLVPLDDAQCWYRYHHLFADLLRNRQSALQDTQTAVLHRRASQWYAQHGMANEAIQHALAAADYAAALHWIETHALDVVLQGYLKTVADWMQALPPSWRTHSPRANLAFAWAHLLRGTTAQAAPYLERLQTLFAPPPADAAADLALQAGWLALQSTVLNGQKNPGASLALAQQALDVAPESDHYVRSLIYLGLAGAYQQLKAHGQAVDAFQMMVHHGQAAGNFTVEMLGYAGLAGMAFRMGRLHQAFQAASQGVERIEASGTRPPTSATVYGLLGAVHYQWNQLERMHRCFERAIQASAMSGYNEVELEYRVFCSRLHLAAGDWEGAGRELQQALDLLPGGVSARAYADVTSQQVRLYLAQGDPTAAEAVLCQSGVAPEDEVTYATDFAHLAYLRLMLYRGTQECRPDALRQGDALACRILAAAEAEQCVDTLVQALLVGALVRAAAGNTQGGLEWLERALALAAPEGYVRVFLDEGAALAALLRQVQKQGRVAEYARNLLAHFSRPVPGPGGKVGETEPAQHHTELVEPIIEPIIRPLTRRELEILHLIGEGCSNQAIAERLVITLHTVKKHSSNIFAKLGVTSRTQAVARARQLGLM